MHDGIRRFGDVTRDDPICRMTRMAVNLPKYQLFVKRLGFKNVFKSDASREERNIVQPIKIVS